MPVNKIRVMISSRCEDKILLGGPEQKYSDMRKLLKRDIENERLFDGITFECWINEDAGPAPGTDDSWNHCLGQVKRAEIVIVLYNGHAGWATETTRNPTDSSNNTSLPAGMDVKRRPSLSRSSDPRLSR